MCWVVSDSCDLMDYSPPGSSVHGIFQVRILEWVAISFSRGSSQLRDQTHVSCTNRQILYHWATWEAQSSSMLQLKKRSHMLQLRPSTVKQTNKINIFFKKRMMLRTSIWYWHWYLQGELPIAFFYIPNSHGLVEPSRHEKRGWNTNESISGATFLSQLLPPLVRQKQAEDASVRCHCGWGPSTLFLVWLNSPQSTELGFLGGPDGKESTCNAEDPGPIPGLGRSSGEKNGNPLQYSCLENPMDRGAWWGTVHRVKKS